MIRPILFNTEMVQAIQAGRKTATRRIVNDRNQPPFLAGDILWVRETWAFWPCITCGEPCVNSSIYSNPMYGKAPETMETADGLTEGCFLYRADGEAPVFPGGHIWRPSIHMPRQAARIFLRVTEVEQDSLQGSINGSPCPAIELASEGIPIYEECKDCIKRLGSPHCVLDSDECELLDQPRWEFGRLWESTVPKSKLARDGWAANPSVWVIRFEQIEKPEGWPG